METKVALWNALMPWIHAFYMLCFHILRQIASCHKALIGFAQNISSKKCVNRQRNICIGVFCTIIYNMWVSIDSQSAPPPSLSGLLKSDQCVSPWVPPPPGMPESSTLPSVWSPVSADLQQIVYFARHGGNTVGPFTGSGFYCSAQPGSSMMCIKNGGGGKGSLKAAPFVSSLTRH